MSEREKLYRTVLRNIAAGHWNAGREEPITVNEYARLALEATGYTARETQAVNLAGNDHAPTCTRCDELSTPGDKWCKSCGAWLLLDPPRSSDLRSRAKTAALLAGHPWPEAVTPIKEREDSP